MSKKSITLHDFGREEYLDGATMRYEIISGTYLNGSTLAYFARLADAAIFAKVKAEQTGRPLARSKSASARWRP